MIVIIIIIIIIIIIREYLLSKCSMHTHMQEGSRKETVIAVGIGRLNYPNSNPGRGCLHFS